MRLLLAVHLYESASELVKEASTWAERLGATLDLVYVDEYLYDSFLSEDAGVRVTLTNQWDQIRVLQAERLDALLQEIPESLRGVAHHPSGRAAPTVVMTGEHHYAILIGTHGHTGLTHFFLGSVAERVVRTAKNHVIVLRVKDAD